jgi:hypothetical protein
LPIYEPWVDMQLGSWQVDSLQKAVLVMPLGAVGLVLSLNLVGPLASVWRRIAESLLRPDDARGPLEVRRRRRRALRVHSDLTVLANVVVLIVWAAVGGSFWPGWVLIGTGLALALHGWIDYVLSREDWRARKGIWPVAMHAGVSVALSISYVLMWALSGGGYFWPAWPILAFTVLLAAHAVIVPAAGMR